MTLRLSQRVRSHLFRCGALAAVGLLLVSPYLRRERVGAGDAQDYAEHIGDFLAQTHAGVLPVLVGQSRYAFNGAFNPLRTAPYLQYMAGILDFLTWGKLGPYGLLNLEIALSLVAAALISYFCLQRLLPGRPWICVMLAGLYISSPGVLSLVYGGDMTPSWLTLPYLPLCAYLTGLIAEDGITTRRVLALAVAMAAIWLAHAPIAMWLSFIVLGVIGWRCLASFAHSGKSDLLALAGAAVVFAGLAGYVFVSVAELRLPTLAEDTLPFRDGTVFGILQQGWHGFLRPVSADAAHLTSDLQLSPGLWLCVFLAAIGWRRAGAGSRALLIAIGALTILLVPLPAVAGRIWPRMPAFVQVITAEWPMQRFYPILSAFAPFAVAFAWRRQPPPRRLAREIVAGLLIVSSLWSGFEAGKFLQRGFRVAVPPELSRRLIDPNDAVQAVYSSAMLGSEPRYHSNGSISPEMQLHLLDPRTLKISVRDTTAILAAAVPGQPAVPLVHFVQTADGAALASPLQLFPGHYLLHFLFKDRIPHGTLVLAAPDVWREYPLPASGGALAFGAGPERPSNLALAIDGPAAEAVDIRFVAQNKFVASNGFADLRVLPYEPATLPLRVVSLIPFAVEVRSDAGGWLETSRLYLPGYRATVGGRTAAVARSPDGLVMVRVPAGRANVALRFPGSWLLRASFWTSLVAWVLLPVVWMAWAIWIWDDQVQAEIDRLFVSYRWHDYLQWVRTQHRARMPCER